MCGVCVETCNRQAIQRAVVPIRGEAAAASVSDISKVVVGSRAEAKAVHKAAKQAAKARGKSIGYTGKPTASGKSAAGGSAALSKGASNAAGKAAPKLRAGRQQEKDGPVRKAASKSVSGGGVPFSPGAVTWTMVDLGVALGMLLLTVLAKDQVLGLHAVALMPAAGRTIIRATVLAVYYSLQLATFAWLAARHGATLARAFGLGQRATSASSSAAKAVGAPSAVGSLGLVVLLFAGTELFAVVYGLAMQAAKLSQPARLSSDLSEVFGSGGVGLALSILLVALVAPFVEELAFRGLVMPVFGSRWGMWPAVVVSAVIYAAYHFSLWLFAPTLVLGVALGWLAWTRRSLWPAILLHVLYNAAAVGAGYFVAR